jgi:uncharacterized protein YhbP (UPF0306 family)
MAQNDFNLVERALRHQTFGTLSTLSVQGRPHATGVVYAVAPKGEPLILYVTTRTTTRKVRNLRAHPDVAFVVPVPRRFIPAFPPRSVQFQGTATVVPSEHDGARRAFDSSWFLRRILLAEQRIVAEGGDLCFICIRPDPTVFTYGIGMSVWDNIRHPRSATGRQQVPNDHPP